MLSSAVRGHLFRDPRGFGSVFSPKISYTVSTEWIFDLSSFFDAPLHSKTRIEEPGRIDGGLIKPTLDREHCSGVSGGVRYGVPRGGGGGAWTEWRGIGRRGRRTFPCGRIGPDWTRTPG